MIVAAVDEPLGHGIGRNRFNRFDIPTRRQLTRQPMQVAARNIPFA